MHKKKIALLLMIQAMVICMSGCGTKDNESEKRESTSVTENSVEESETETTTVEVSSEEQNSETEESSEAVVESESTEKVESVEASSIVEEPEEVSYYIQECQLIEGMNSTFSEDRAWLSFFAGNGRNMFGIIDTEGNVIYEVPEELSDVKGVWNNTTFSNGTSCLYTSDMSTDHVALIFNRDGGIVFDSREYGATIPFVYIGDAEGKYLFYITKADFYESQSYVLVVNNDGSIAAEIEAPYFGQRLIFNYYGAGIFTCGGDYTINTNTNSIIELGYSNFRSNVFSDNTVAIREYGIVSIDNIASQDIWEAYVASHEKVTDNTTSYSSMIYEDTTLGYYFLDSGKCYQYQMGTHEKGEPIIDFQYGRISHFFYDGYSVVYMVGADGKEYIGLIDTAGNFQYEPIAIKAWNMWESYHANDIITKGYIYAELEDDSRVIITPTGEQLVLGVDDTSSIPKDVIIGSNESGITVSSGMASLNMYKEYVRQKYFDFAKAHYTGYYNLSTNEVITMAKRKVELEQ